VSTLLARLRPKRLPNADNETSLNILLQTAEIVLAARLRARVLLHHNATKRFAPGKRMIPKSGVRFSDKIMRKKEGGEAPKGACQPFPRNINKRCRSSMSRRGCAPNRGAPAFRRYAAALAGTSLLSSRPCFLGRGQRTMRTSCVAKAGGRYPPSPVPVQ